jgi:phosphatidate cytidylyltransferase
LKNLIPRTLTGILFVALIVAAICLHPFLFAGVFGVATALLIREFYALTKFEGSAWQRLTGIIGGAYLFISACLYAGGYVGREAFLPYIVIMLIYVASGLYIRTSNPVAQWCKTFFAHFYCAGSLSLLCFIHYTMSPEYVPALMVFIFIWINDTSAFLIGSWKGKRRLFPRISPLKSWEGFVGGFVVTVAAAMVLSYFFRELTWYYWLLFAAITVVSGTFGDLIESLIKRTYGAKDSGNILPGHGGMLDRLDSVIFASPFVYVFFEIIATRN